MRHHERLHGDKATLIEGTWGAELARLEAETQRIKADPSVSTAVKDYANYCWHGIQAGLREYMKNPGERAAQLLVEVGEIFQPFAQGAKQVAKAGDGKRVANDLVEGGVALGLDYMMVAAFGPAGYAANVGAKGVTKIAKGANKFGKFLWGVHEAAVEHVAGVVMRSLQHGEIRLELRYKPGSDRRDFDRKLTALQDLAARGKLVKAEGVLRDDKVTLQYRRAIMDQARLQWGVSEPMKVARVEQRLKTLEADHLHELQLGGVDHGSALALIDGSVNGSIGAQIMHQIKKLPVGAKITKVVEKG